MATRAPAEAWVGEHGVAADCPRCGTAYAPLQEYCLECGLRLPEHALGDPPPGFMSSLPAGGAWAWPALVGLVVAGIAIAAVVIARVADEPEAEVLVATVGPPPFVPATEQASVPQQPLPTLPTPRRTQPAGTTAAPPPPPRSGGLVSWPPRRTGWTVVLASYPTAGGRDTAADRAREASDAGVRDVGVLESSEHASLHPGYFVVFAGIHESEEDARDALEAAQTRGYEAAYIREITPSR